MASELKDVRMLEIEGIMPIHFSDAARSLIEHEVDGADKRQVRDCKSDNSLGILRCGCKKLSKNQLEEIRQLSS